jgi:hypothetical protein
VAATHSGPHNSTEEQQVTQDLLETINGGIATLTMNRPEARNASTREMMLALGLFNEVVADAELRARAASLAATIAAGPPIALRYSPTTHGMVRPAVRACIGRRAIRYRIVKLALLASQTVGLATLQTRIRALVVVGLAGFHASAPSLAVPLLSVVQVAPPSRESWIDTLPATLLEVQRIVSLLLLFTYTAMAAAFFKGELAGHRKFIQEANVPPE